MCAIEAIRDPADFAPAQTRSVDWAFDSGSGTAMSPPRFVNDRPSLYTAGGGALVVNPGGKPAQFRRCSDIDISVNFRQGEALVTARDTSPSTTAPSAPLQLLFTAPLRAVGTYVTVGGSQGLQGQAVHALMWVQLTDSEGWNLVANDGLLGDPLPPGSNMTAPFVGARSIGAAGIRRVSFDASSTAAFNRIAINELLWVGMT